MIRNPNDIQEGAKKIRMLIAGYPSIMEIRAGLEPVIAAVKGLCPNHLDERTVWQGEVLPAY